MQTQVGRDRARENRLGSARERRLRPNPEQLARDQRIDEAAVDVELAWEERPEAEQALTVAEVAAETAIGRLLAEQLAIKDVVRLTGLDQATVRASYAGVARHPHAWRSVRPLGRRAGPHRGRPAQSLNCLTCVVMVERLISCRSATS